MPTSSEIAVELQTVTLILKDEAGRAGLVVRCLQGRPEVYIAWLNSLGSEAPAVTSRLGEQLAQTTRWGLSTDSRASFYPGDDAQFVRELQQLVLGIAFEDLEAMASRPTSELATHDARYFPMFSDDFRRIVCWPTRASLYFAKISCDSVGNTS